MTRAIHTNKLKAGDLIAVEQLSDPSPDYYLVLAVKGKLLLYYFGSQGTAAHPVNTGHFKWRCDVYRNGEPMVEGFDPE